jgi:hypothetical protein
VLDTKTVWSGGEHAIGNCHKAVGVHIKIFRLSEENIPCEGVVLQPDLGVGASTSVKADVEI